MDSEADRKAQNQKLTPDKSEKVAKLNEWLRKGLAFVLGFMLMASLFQNCANNSAQSTYLPLNSSTVTGAPYQPLPTGANGGTGTASACNLPGWASKYSITLVAGFPAAGVLADPLQPDGYFAFDLTPGTLPTGLAYAQVSGFSGTPTQPTSSSAFNLVITSNCTNTITTPVTLTVLANQGIQSIKSGATSNTTCAMNGSGNVCWGFGFADTAATSYSPVSIPGIPANLSGFFFVGFNSLWAKLSDSSVWMSDLQQGLAGSTVYAGSFGISHASQGIDSNKNLYICYVGGSGAVACNLPSGSTAYAPNNIASGATAVATSGGSGCAIVSGAVKCWGAIVGSTTAAATVGGLTSGATSLAMTSNQVSACAVVNGTVYCWGSELNGALGTVSSTGSSTTPMAISGLTAAASVVAGGNHFCAIQGAAVYCWGLNSSGQLGNGTLVSTTTSPVQVENINNATQITAGVLHTCALLSAGTVDCWGDNTYSQMSSSPASAANNPTPVEIIGL